LRLKRTVREHRRLNQLGDGLLLHAGLDPARFRWSNIAKALDAILEGIAQA
jgi:hypothetical protein